MLCRCHPAPAEREHGIMSATPICAAITRRSRADYPPKVTCRKCGYQFYSPVCCPICKTACATITLRPLSAA